MHIALFGGSFDPPHLAHVEILDHLLEDERYDLVLVVPSGQHPFKKSLASFADRIAMCELAFQELGDRVQVLDIEKDLSGYTVDLIARLDKLFPQSTVTFVGGSDLERELDQWKDLSDLRKKIRFEFLPRAPEHPSDLSPFSSTEIRARLKNHLPIAGFVPKAVEAYIQKKNLYC